MHIQLIWSYFFNYMISFVLLFQHSAATVPTSFQAAPFSRQSLGPIGGGLGGLSYGSFGQNQQGLPGASGGFQLGGSAPAQPSELSPGVSGGGVGGSLEVGEPPAGAPPAPIGAPGQGVPQAGKDPTNLTRLIRLQVTK